MDSGNDEKKRKYLIPAGIKKVCVLVILTAVLIGIIFLYGRYGRKTEKEIITEATLEKVIDVDELSTFEAVYNGITEVMNKEHPENIDYYVYYEAKVDDEGKKIFVTIPEIKINDINVDIASLDYIFENEKADTGTVSQEAYKAAIEDVTNESARENKIFQLAEQNAKNIIEALITPFLRQLDEEYMLEVNQEVKK